MDPPRSASDTTLALTADDKRTLLRIARQAIEEYLAHGRRPTVESDVPALCEPRATFVTLRERDTGTLRGCRGESAARRPIIESVAHTAIASATDDPRFPPVTADELGALHIEISALTPLAPIRPEDVTVGRHGLMIRRGGRSGLLLPTVPTTYGWDHDEFLAWVCRKAGLPDDAWRSDDVTLLGFESDTWAEDD